LRESHDISLQARIVDEALGIEGKWVGEKVWV
jgi:hypothetical protein